MELKSGMIITLEPGIYLLRRQAGLPGKFGYRYENTLLLA
jgi:Xaa-Pro aminopeptidase